MAYINLTQDQLDSVIQAINNRAALSGATFTGAVSGTTFDGSFIGNADSATLAASATKLAMARTINGVSFDGTANITVADSTKEPVIAAGTSTQYLRGDKTWATFPSIPTVPTVVSAFTNDSGYQTAAQVVATKVDASVLADSATKLATARTINGVAFDGTADITFSATDSTPRIPTSEKGAANGVATLDDNGLVPSTQLPSYVDDVIEAANMAAFPAIGETGKIYVDVSNNKTYRWSGTVYVYITSGAVDSVAGKTGVVTLVKADVGLSNVDNTADADKNVLSAASATKLTTARNIALAGDTTGTVSFDGTANVSITTTLSNSGVTAGTYNSVTVDAKGRVTAGTVLADANISALIS